MARAINKTDVIKELDKLAANDARLNSIPRLKETIAEAFNKSPDYTILDTDLSAVVRALGNKPTITSAVISETVRNIVEAKDKSNLRLAISAFLSKEKPRGMKLDVGDVDLIIQRFKLKSNSSLTKIKQAVDDFVSSPRNVQTATPQELRHFTRKELEKRGPVDARLVDQLVKNYQKTHPDSSFSHDEIKNLVRSATPRIQTVPPMGVTNIADAQPLDRIRRPRGSTNANSYVTSPKITNTGTKYRKTFFDTIRTKMQRYGLRPLTKQARNWLTDSVRKTTSPTEAALFKRSTVETSLAEAMIGKMFLYIYDAKWKEELPYWDKFPLIFVVDIYDDGWLGVNLHYLPIKLRLTLFDALLSLANDSSLDRVQRLRISYSILKNFSNFPLVKPCLKRYLSHHVDSGLLEIKPFDWEIAVFLPCEQFQKQSNESVWADSKRIITRQQDKQ